MTQETLATDARVIRLIGDAYAVRCSTCDRKLLEGKIGNDTRFETMCPRCKAKQIVHLHRA